jgi:glycosyltransferase involved in cell wall biosynthesis
MNATGVAIVVPTFNRANLLPEAIESALAQTVACEVVVVDHGSTDATPSVVAGYGERVKYVRREVDDGPCIAWFDGILRSNSEYVHIQYDDDWIAPDFVERTLPLFNEKVGLVFTVAKVVGAAGEIELFREFNLATGYHLSAPLIRQLLAKPLTVSPGCAVFRRKDALDALMMNPVFGGKLYHGAGPDLMLFLATLARYPAFGFVADPLAFFRAHGDSITTNALQDQAKTERLVLAYDEYKLLFLSHLAATRTCGGWLHRAIELGIEHCDRLKIFG